MISNKILPAHIIRLYLWDLLQQETGLKKVNGLVPILPIEDEPKVADANETYAIYSYSENDTSDSEQIKEGIFALKVSAPTFSELGRLLNVVSLAFESSDIGTEVLNYYSTQYENQALHGIRFVHAKTAYVDGGDPADTEGGEIYGVVNIGYRYINSLPTPV